MMIGMWADNAQTYLLVLTVVTFFAFTLLLFLKPLLWAKLLLWHVPEAPRDTHLALYFGRCLGAFAVVTNVFFLQAALKGIGVVLMLQFFTLFCVLMVIVHIWGAIEKTQPITETLEIGFWALLVFLNLAFMPMADPVAG